MYKYLFPFILAFSAQAATVDVYLAAGQSNAKAVWAQAIESELRELSSTENIVVAHSTHPGAWFYKWWNDGPQQNYLDDAAAVTAVFERIRKEGDEPVLKGIFWFQGEGDTKSKTHVNQYRERFTAYVDQLKKDFFASDLSVVINVIDGNSDPAYDAPEKMAGRSRQQIENMRTVLFELGDEFPGIAIDTRPYRRSDAWHVVSDDLKTLGLENARRFHQYMVMRQ